MWTSIKTTLHRLWIVGALLTGTAIGVATGWDAFGFGGAIGCGLIGLIVGAIAAGGPKLILGFFTTIT